MFFPVKEYLRSNIFYLLKVQRNEYVLLCLAFSSLCNSLFSCLDQGAVARLQMFQNAAACLLIKTENREHIIPVLALNIGCLQNTKL